MADNIKNKAVSQSVKEKAKGIKTFGKHSAYAAKPTDDGTSPSTQIAPGVSHPGVPRMQEQFKIRSEVVEQMKDVQDVAREAANKTK